MKGTTSHFLALQALVRELGYESFEITYYASHNTVAVWNTMGTPTIVASVDLSESEL